MCRIQSNETQSLMKKNFDFMLSRNAKLASVLSFNAGFSLAKLCSPVHRFAPLPGAPETSRRKLEQKVFKPQNETARERWRQGDHDARMQDDSRIGNTGRRASYDDLSLISAKGRRNDHDEKRRENETRR